MKVVIKLSEKSIDEAIEKVKKYEKWLDDCTNKLIDRLTMEGETYAIEHLYDYDYDGAQDDNLTNVYGYREGNKGFIVAGGNAIWIEFGTGVIKNTEKHPKADELGMSPWGTYGKGKGASPSGWWYWDEARDIPVHTEGVQANMFMYRTGQYLRERFPSLAKEIFK